MSPGGAALVGKGHSPIVGGKKVWCRRGRKRLCQEGTSNSGCDQKSVKKGGSCEGACQQQADCAHSPAQICGAG